MKRFIDIISPQRIEAYRLTTQENDEDVLNRYLYNIKLGEAFYPWLDFLEVSLRNKINKIFIEDFGEDWLIDNDFFDTETQKSVNEVIERLNKKKKYAINYRLVAELNFGFWSNLFNKKYHVIWQQEKRTNRVFINSRFDIKTINRELDILRKFRNRVFHFETIYNHNPETGYALLQKYIKALSPCPDFDNIIDKMDRLKKLL